MKTISEFRDEMMEKAAAGTVDIATALPAFMTVPMIAGAAGGKLYSDFTAPPKGTYSTFETELLKNKLVNILKARKERAHEDKLEAVLNGSQRTIRL